MPCRTRRGGLDVEGLGMVFLEAAACGRPVVAGTSGGAPEAVQEGVTGHVVEPRSADAVAATIAGLLDDPDRGAGDGRGRAGLGRAALVLDDDRRDLRRAARRSAEREARGAQEPALPARPLSARRGSSTSASNSFMTTARLSFRLGVSIPLSSVKSVPRIANFLIASAWDTALLASFTAASISA